MKLSRIGKISVGVTVGLVAAAPLAWAGGTGYDTDESGNHDQGHSKHDDEGNGPSRDHDGHDGHDDGGHGHDGHRAGPVCAFDGGDAEANSLVGGESLAAAVAQAPVAGSNIANLANCSDFLNNNGNGNLSGNEIVVGNSLPQLPIPLP